MLSKKRNYIRGVADISVSVDGTRQKRGYTSLNVVIVAISIDIGKIVDLEILTRYCRQCDIQNKLVKDNIEALNTWKENHRDQCKRSIEERGARYTEYYGDGDSKAYSTVRNIYEGKEVETFECIGH